jgi:hypothetical protein
MAKLDKVVASFGAAVLACAGIFFATRFSGEDPDQGAIFSSPSGDRVAEVKVVERRPGLPASIIGVWKDDHHALALELDQSGRYVLLQIGSDGVTAIELKEQGSWSELGGKLVLSPQSFEQIPEGELLVAGPPRAYEVDSVTLDFTAAWLNPPMVTRKEGLHLVGVAPMGQLGQGPVVDLLLRPTRSLR